MNENLYHAALAVDDEYGNELRRLFGVSAGDVRYSKQGAGALGSNLRRLHDAKLAVDTAFLNTKAGNQ